MPPCDRELTSATWFIDFGVKQEVSSMLLACVTTIVPTAVVACAARGEGGSPAGCNLQAMGARYKNF